jgi:hypothetical protein
MPDALISGDTGLPDVRNLSDRDLLIYQISAMVALKKDVSKICQGQADMCKTVGDHQTAIAVMESHCADRVAKAEAQYETISHLDSKVNIIESEIQSFQGQYFGVKQSGAMLLAILTLLLVAIGRMYDMGMFK